MERYYSAHVLRWPLLAMLRCLFRTNPFVVILLWPILLLKKIPGFKPAITYAIAYPDEISIIDWESIPNHARVPLESRMRECEQLGFGDAMYYHPHSIGQYEHYEVAMLHHSGQHIMQLRWFRANNAGYKAQDCQVFCSSVLQQGGVFSSAAIAKIHDVPEMLLGDVQRRIYPETTTTEALFDYHQAGLPAGATLRQFDLFSYTPYLAKRTRQLVDLMLEKRICFELTPSQIEKLKKTD